MKPKFMPLSPAIGAEIEGVDIIKPLDDEAFEGAAAAPSENSAHSRNQRFLESKAQVWHRRARRSFRVILR